MHKTIIQLFNRDFLQTVVMISYLACTKLVVFVFVFGQAYLKGIGCARDF